MLVLGFAAGKAGVRIVFFVCLGAGGGAWEGGERVVLVGRVWRGGLSGDEVWDSGGRVGFAGW